MNLTVYPYRFADAVLANDTFRDTWTEARSVFQRLPAVRRTNTDAEFLFDPVAMNGWLDAQFGPLGWEIHPRITDDTRLEGDYLKNRVQIEVQFGNMARWTYDVFKFQICYSQGRVDVGILAVPTQAFARRIGDNIAYYERVCRELPHAKLSITLPIMVVGLEPEQL